MKLYLKKNPAIMPATNTLRRISASHLAFFGVLLTFSIFLASCGGEGGASHLVVADDRGDIYLAPVGAREIKSEQRIGRLGEITDGNPTDDIILIKDNTLGIPEYITHAPLMQTKTGDRLTAYSDRRGATILERGPLGEEIGEGSIIAAGELKGIVYYFDDDVLYYEESSGFVETCYVSVSGKDPERIAIGDSCRIHEAVGLVEVHTNRSVTFYDYKGEEQLELNTARFSDVDVRILSGGEALAATLQAESGLTELIYGRFSGEQDFLTANDNVTLLTSSINGDWFAYSERSAGEPNQVFIANGALEEHLGEGRVEFTRMARDGERMSIGIVNDLDRLEVWQVSLLEESATIELIYETHSGDVDDVFLQYLPGSETYHLLMMIDEYSADRHVVELRINDEVIALTPSTNGNSGQELVPLGAFWIWLSEQDTGNGDPYTIIELVNSEKVIDSEDVSGSILSSVILDDKTMAVSINQFGANFLTTISVDDDALEITDLTASDNIHQLLGIDGRVYARSGSPSGFSEVVTARAGEDDVESLDHDITHVVAVMSSGISRYSFP